MTTTANPRRIALDILLRIAREKAFADQLLDHELTHGNLQGPDRGLLTELVYGVSRWQGRLDHILSQCSSRPLARLERQVLVLLRLGLYQVIMLDRIPVSAAVNETVKLANALVPKAAGFINAVLRQADREREKISYPDQQQDTAAYLAARYSEPLWLTSQWLQQLGPAEAEQLARAMNEPPPLTIRSNTLRCERGELLQILGNEGALAEPCRYAPDGIILRGAPQPVSRLQSFQQGLWTVQDEAAQLVSLLLAPAAGDKVLDLCAAPGGKSTHLAQMMANQGEITACDVNQRKLDLVNETARRLGITSITTRLLNPAATASRLGREQFQRIMIDAPCSGLGVLRRNPEGKWRKTLADITQLAAQQRLLLGLAAERLAENGILVYATCSTSEAENEAVIDDFLSQQPDFVLEDVKELFPDLAGFATSRGLFRSWPHRQGMDGFCAARLRKR